MSEEEAHPQDAGPKSGQACVLVEFRDDIAVVTLNRPAQLNAIDVAMATELSAVFTSMNERKDVRVILLRGAGRHFSAGADLDSDAFASPGPGFARKQMQIQHIFSGLIRSMRTCPQPIIALLHGAAVGGGFSIALAADVRIAAEGGRMNAGYLLVGLGGCDMGSGYFLPRLVGASVASELLLTGEFIDAERALTCGLVSRVVDREALLKTGLEMASAMTRASPTGLRMTKESLNACLTGADLDTVLNLEDRQQVLLMGTEDHREAVLAFKEKRDPVYTDS